MKRLSPEMRLETFPRKPVVKGQGAANGPDQNQTSVMGSLTSRLVD